MIYLQAKRWNRTVDRPRSTSSWVPSMASMPKGIFITTSAFSTGAKEYAANIDPRVILIDGAQLTELMIDFDVGVTAIAAYEIKRIDLDYFTERSGAFADAVSASR